MITFRLAHYDANGALLRSSTATPVGDPADPQVVADLCARAADVGCGYQAGTYLVWADRDIQPPERIEQAPAPNGRRVYGPGHPSVPAYRWHRLADWAITLIPI